MVFKRTARPLCDSSAVGYVRLKTGFNWPSNQLRNQLLGRWKLRDACDPLRNVHVVRLDVLHPGMRLKLQFENQAVFCFEIWEQTFVGNKRNSLILTTSLISHQLSKGTKTCLGLKNMPSRSGMNQAKVWTSVKN